MEWLVDAAKTLPHDALQRVQAQLARVPPYPGLDRPSEGLSAPKLTASQVGTLAKLLAVALLGEPSAEVVRMAIVAALEWQHQRDLPFHNDTTLAELKRLRLRRAPPLHIFPLEIDPAHGGVRLPDVTCTVVL